MMESGSDRRSRGSPFRGAGAVLALTALVAAGADRGDRAGFPPSVAAAPSPRTVAPAPDPEAATAAGRASFSVAFRDLVVPYEVFLLRALPGESLTLRTDGGARGDRFRLVGTAGRVVPAAGSGWTWTAPATPGVYRLVIRREPAAAGPRSVAGAAPAAAPTAASDSIVLNAVVLVPFRALRDGELDGYALGRYPEKPFRDLARYRRPMGFVRLRPENADVRVSPHFTLGQFPAKGPPGWPKYLVLNERLLLKLEMTLEEARRRGIRATTFRVLSGYRSPWYNGDLGRPAYSRHVYGDAADIYVDEDGDGRMDDLTGDGRIDVRDARVLYDIVEEMDRDASRRFFLGGLGQYRTTRAHGPFIHLDTRGYRARW